MSFEWQDIDQAAATLEVELDTLQKWIEEGHAPSRDKNGTTQVLIEFPDDEGESEEVDAETASSVSDEDKIEDVDGDDVAEAPHIIDGEYEEFRATDDGSGTYVIQQSHQRELQLAGGMVAAWKQLAETADQELVRSRKQTTRAWWAIGVLVFVLLISWWNLSGDITDARERAGIAETKLTNAKTNNQQQADQIKDLLDSLAGVEKKLSSEERQSHAMRQRLTTTSIQIDRLSEQLKSTKELAGAQAKTFDKTQASLEETIKQERERAKGLENKLEASNKVALELQKEIGELKKKLAELLVEKTGKK